MIPFSIVICTHNPQEEIFQRLLDALLQLAQASVKHEVILIDNNSTPSLAVNKYVSSFLAAKESARLITEQTPGLTAARLAGISAAAHEWVIFFDDDNEPAADYLLRASEAIDRYPKTGAWGAAEVEVEYIGKAAEWLEHEKILFQQRSTKETIFTNEPHWQACYPYGTGLIIRKDIALLYKERVTKQQYTLTDRKGKSLASGGDVQMVLTAIEQGYSAGVISGLHIKHLIDTSKATLFYLQRQQYGTASAYIKAYNQVFIKDPVPVVAVNNKKVFMLAYSLFRIYYKKLSRHRFRLLVASKMGELNAMVEANASRQPLLLKLYEKFIYV